MHVRIKRSYDFTNDRGEKITAPRGWIGDLPDRHAEAAIKSGHAVPGNPQALPEGDPEPDPDGLDAKTKAELEALAKERSLDVSAAKTKADLIEALRKA
nr:SAP domain-containing protein [Methylorubrum zatmanii]